MGKYYPKRRYMGIGEVILERFCIAFEKLFFGSSEIEKCNKLLYDIEKEDAERRRNIKYGSNP